MSKLGAENPSIRSSRRKGALACSRRQSKSPYVGCYEFLVSASVSLLLTLAPFCACAQEVPGTLPTQTTSQISITIEGGYRIIHANGLPDHTPGRFPNPGNPNSIAPQHYKFRVPLNPQVADKPTPFTLGIFGIAINGVVFDPGANEWWNDDPRSGWQYEPMTGPRKLGIDQNNAHVQPNGAYHYHGVPSGLLANVHGAKQRMVLIGWAADGFPIYAPWAYSDPRNDQSPLVTMKSSYRLKPGVRADGPPGNYDGSFVKDFEYVAGLGDLDGCNGRFGVTPEFPNGTYQYFVTTNFPFIPRMFRGSPDQSWLRRGGPPRGRPPGGPNFSSAPGLGFSPPPPEDR
jgi:hypothetical protein